MGPLDGASQSFPHSLSPAQNQNKAEHRQSRENQIFESESELHGRIRASSQNQSFESNREEDVGRRRIEVEASGAGGRWGSTGRNYEGGDDV